ncbi:hypothetical protein BC835DRAFT_312278 [Cytidiella melzeri]|nr:hypothetical protein BC835DRAFT_312278 [Cytidiella melzeri]
MQQSFSLSVVTARSTEKVISTGVVSIVELAPYDPICRLYVYQPLSSHFSLEDRLNSRCESLTHCGHSRSAPTHVAAVEVFPPAPSRHGETAASSTSHNDASLGSGARSSRLPTSTCPVALLFPNSQGSRSGCGSKQNRADQAAKSHRTRLFELWFVRRTAEG